MATQETKGAANPLIRQSSLDERRERRLLLLIPAVLISVVFHTGLFLCLFFLLPGPGEAGPPVEAVAQNEANVQPEPPPEPVSTDPLTITDVDPAALEPDVEINYNLDRKADVSVPGIVNPNEPVGIEGGDKTAPPMNIPAPQGFGGGQGGALTAEFEGSSSLVGQAGGVAGLRGMPLAGTFYGRSGGTREKALREGGGTGASEASVAAGLHWLIKIQSPDGSWRLDGNFKDKGQSNDIAGTALGLLPLLAGGKTHKASKDNPWDKPIERALLFLMRKQDKRTGNFGGGMYAHCLATIAMCEAYGMTQDPILRRPTQMGINYLITAQHEGGGWRYSPGQAGDTSVTGWGVMALKSAKMSGLDVPEVSFKKAVRYLDSCVAPDEGYGYVGPGSTPTMTAVGLLCRQYLQAWGPQNPKMIKGVDNHLRKAPPGGNNIYYYYYATQVMHHFGGDAWKAWNDKMREQLISKQDRSTGPLNGSWPPAGDPHAAAGGRLMVTSLSLLTLEVYYRHLPLYYREAGERQQKLLTTGPAS